MLFDAAGGEAFFAPRSKTGDYAPYEIRDIVDRVGLGLLRRGLLHAIHSNDFATPTAP